MVGVVPGALRSSPVASKPQPKEPNWKPPLALVEDDAMVVSDSTGPLPSHPTTPDANGDHGGGVAVVIAGLTGYFVRNHYFPGTNDAYVHAYTISVSPYVEGYIKRVHTSPNALVKRGQLIYEITPLPFELSVEQRRQRLNEAVNQKSVLEDRLLQAQQTLKDLEAREWITDPIASVTPICNSNRSCTRHGSGIEAASLKPKPKRKQPWKSRAFKRDSEAGIKHRSPISVGQKVNLDYTRYYAPMDAFVSNNFSLREGQYVKPGQVLFKLIDNRQWWVDANFQETQIHRIRTGMTAKIKLDMYPGITFQGQVINISRGSGSFESLLPPQNATGNWVKVPQRFPVRIRMQQNQEHPLRAGSTAHARVDTLNAQSG